MSNEFFAFDVALDMLHNGKRVAREGWDNAFVFLVPGSTFTVNRPPLLGMYPEGTEITYKSHIDKRYADGEVGVWTATMPDLLAEDWRVVG